MKTSERVLSAATTAFGEFGYDSTSLDDLAKELGIRKQSILYHFPSKEQLLASSVDKAIDELILVLDEAIRTSRTGWDRVESIVKSVFRLAIRRPELLGLLREVTRLGPPVLTRAVDGINPLLKGATDWLREEMEAGRIRHSDPELLVLSIYSTVMGAATEVKLFEAIGEKQTLRGAALRRKELLRFLKSALSPDGF
ncbi:MAG: TetR/AcrR family transcriptional regulator [Acidimicrobiales bacterium]|nr:TetR/AcrR family transcriptional regulator [Acidimicrobiales bacterium]HJM27840.1 TetR/AcrR family transcriptional regulator [Acidimicrobiales bacterium]